MEQGPRDQSRSEKRDIEKGGDEARSSNRSASHELKSAQNPKTPAPVLPVYLVVALLVVSLGLDLFLAWRVRRLEGIVDGMTPLQTTSVVGESLKPFNCDGASGNKKSVTFNDSTRPVVLYFFNPHCHWCALNLENIKALAKARHREFRFIGISLEGPDLRSYISSASLGFPVCSVKSYSTVRGMTVAGTPQMLVVSHKGQVVKNWVGALAGSRLTGAEGYFKVNLPGITRDEMAGVPRLGPRK